MLPFVQVAARMGRHPRRKHEGRVYGMAQQPNGPGWYRRYDWAKLHTYFDGEQWTAQTRDLRAAEVRPPENAPFAGTDATASGPELSTGSFVAKPRPEGTKPPWGPTTFGEGPLGILVLAVVAGVGVWFLWTLFTLPGTREPLPAGDPVTAAEEESQAFGFLAGLTLAGEGRPRSQEECGTFWDARDEPQLRRLLLDNGFLPARMTEYEWFLKGCFGV